MQDDYDDSAPSLISAWLDSPLQERERESLEDHPRNRSPATSSAEKVNADQAIVLEDQRIKV